MSESKVEQFTIEAADSDDLLDAVTNAGKEEQEAQEAKKAKKKKHTEKANAPEFKEAVKALKEKRTDEEIQKQAAIIDTLLKYYNHPRFHDLLVARGFEEQMKPTNLKKLSIPELEELLTAVKAYVANKNDVNIISYGYFFAVGQLESSSITAPLNRFLPDLTGISQLLKENDQVADALAELEIQNGNFLQLSPTKRLLLSTVFAMVTAGTLNKQKRDLAEMIAAAAVAEQQAKVDDEAPEPEDE